MPKLEIVFDRDEIEQKLAYRLICETRESSVWDTGRRRRRWVTEFTYREREAAARIFAQAHSWYLVKGLHDSVRMSLGTLELWQKLEAFCGSL